MNAARTVCNATIAESMASRSTGAAIALFAAVASARFALSLDAGAALGAEAAWAAAAAPVLPFLSCVLSMRLWSRDGESSQLELLLSAPVRTGALVRGKFAGAWLLSLFALALYAAVPVFVLPFFAQGAQTPGIASIAPAFAALAVQSALWCAAGSFASAACGHAASAGAATLLATVCLPYAGYRAALAWMPEIRARMAALPPVEHAVDMATGLVSVAATGGYILLAAAALFAAAQTLESLRCAGRGRRGMRIALHVSSLLAFALAGTAAYTLDKAGMSWELSDRGKESSAAILRRACESAGGGVKAICFMSRKSPLHPAAARLMRGLERTAKSCGADVSVSFADPNWDAGAAAALAADGIPEDSVVFERGNRRIAVPAKDFFPEGAYGDGDLTRAETVCAAAVSNLRPRPGRNAIYATAGHGEASFQEQGPYGLGKFARWLGYDGFEVKPLDLSAVPSVPPDCCVLAVAGARERFSEQELAKVDSYLRSGGRMLVTALPRPGAGLAAYLRGWGCKITQCTAVTPPPFPATDVKAVMRRGHPATEPIAGSSALFGQCAVLENEPAPAGEGGRTSFAVLAESDTSCWGESDLAERPWTFDPSSEPSGPLVLAAAVERGGAASSEIGVRPARIVVTGDTGMAMNAAIEKRGNANLGFLLNCVRWLADSSPAPSAGASPPASAQPGVPAGSGRIGFLAVSALLIPGISLFAMLPRRRGGRRRRRQ